MLTLRRRAVACLLAAVAPVFPMLPARSASVCINPVNVGRILFMGDSITAMLGTAPRLRNLLDQGCASYEIVNAGVGGIGTKEHWPAATQVIAAVQPDLIVINSGTNDDPGTAQTNVGPLPFADRYARMIDALAAAKKPTARLYATYPTYPRTPPAPAWISMRGKTDVIYRTIYPGFAAGDYTMRAGMTGMVTLNTMPGSMLDSGGIHPTTDVGVPVIQEQIYRAIAPTYGLAPLAPDPRLSTVQYNGG